MHGVEKNLLWYRFCCQKLPLCCMIDFSMTNAWVKQQMSRPGIYLKDSYLIHFKRLTHRKTLTNSQQHFVKSSETDLRSWFCDLNKNTGILTKLLSKLGSLCINSNVCEFTVQILTQKSTKVTVTGWILTIQNNILKRSKVSWSILMCVIINLI